MANIDKSKNAGKKVSDVNENKKGESKRGEEFDLRMFFRFADYDMLTRMADYLKTCKGCEFVPFDDFEAEENQMNYRRTFSMACILTADEPYPYDILFGIAKILREGKSGQAVWFYDKRRPGKKQDIGIHDVLEFVEDTDYRLKEKYHYHY